ncbi:uncharacterized protein J4E92_002992 [Alternaria infectoria]|uniref:uncharacterized protein n=1 Tax=Alternaria infectoria TaxID=45303 RepID=UPI00221E92C2|nr:uncharacterized protein J4E92_002992 [Alternaria infectoria]KAI4935701.1 hypothetical protein J4E92_002992 [Alternaria infectoria]
MFLMSTLLLLLLPTSLFAKTIPRADNVEIHTKPTKCLHYVGFSSETITFKDLYENNTFDYAIVTKYTTYYPAILSNALVSKYFELSVLSKDQLCGWTKAASVHSSLGLDFNNHRGDIYWKHSAASQTAQNLYPENAIRAIQDILEYNPPAGDVYMFSTIILAWTTSLFGYILLMLLLMACIRKADRTTNTSNNNEVDEGIELESIKAPDTESLAGADSAAAGPFEDVKWEYPSPQRSTNTKRPEPLPMYSLWGSSHAVA